MTVPELAAFLEGFAAFHCPPAEDVPSDDEYLAVLAEEIAAGRA